MTKTLLGIALSCFMAATLHAQDTADAGSSGAAEAMPPLTDMEAVRALAEQAMAAVAASDPEAFVAALRPYWLQDPAKLDSFSSQLSANWRAADSAYGPVLGMEFVGQTHVGASLLRMVYLEKRKSRAVAWTLAFYRPADSWTVSTVGFTDELDPFYRKDE